MTTDERLTKARLIVGCGYLGMRVARLWQAQASQVFALTRKLERAEGFRRQGWSPLVGDLCGSLPPWPKTDTVLLAVGYDRSSGQPIDKVYVEGVRRVVDSLPDSVSRIVYISSTGVYGSAEGEWVDELTDCQPTRPGGAACLAAERLLAASRFADRTIILRLAGIYGPDRLPRIQAIANGDPIAANPTGYLNLIHVDDAARIVVEAERNAFPPVTYCVSDNAPVRRGDFLALAAELLQLSPPRFVAADDSDRRGSDKRINSSRIFRDMPMQLQYPSYQEGLRQAVEESPGVPEDDN